MEGGPLEPLEDLSGIEENSIIPLDSILPPELFLVPIKSRPVFPGIITPLIVPSGKFAKAVEESVKGNSFLGLVLLKDEENEKETSENIYQFGVVAKILKKVNLPDNAVNILVNTIRRFKIDSFVNKDPLVAKVSYPEEEPGAPKNITKAMMRTLLVMTRELAQNNPLFTEEMKLTMLNVNEPGKMADFVCSILNLEKEEYQSVIESNILKTRIEKVLLFLKKEIELVSIQREISDQIQDKIDKQQRQFFLREQLKAIQNELGIKDDKFEKKYEKFLERLKNLNADPEVIEEVTRELDKFSYADPNTGDYNVIRNYLDILESLPWEPAPVREIDLEKAKKTLDKDHYKLEDVKDRILEFLAVKKLKNDEKGTILLLVGPPGVGKTSIARSIAEAMGRKFFRFSVGGMRDEAEIKGHRRTYIGSMPGKIISALRITKERDCVILLDEIDKLSIGIQGDPASALLEVLDPEQNKNFRDHYLDLPFDISNVFFIATANTLDSISRILLDRMEIINLSGYITDEKVQIFQKYLWKKVLYKNGITPYGIEFDKKAIVALIDSYSRESGVRGLEKVTDKLVRKIAIKIVRKESFPKIILEKDLETFLGVPKFTNERMVRTSVPGTALGLAWTSVGGATLLIEALFVKGKGGILLTGMIGKTMEESSNIALSYIKNFLYKEDLFNNRMIHLHVPDGATPKDGPSAGITMASAILSLALNTKVKSGFGMTGELTLTGEVLAIGGLREKIVAAKRVGIHKIIYPKDNLQHLEEIPDYVKKGMYFFPVSRYEEVALLLFDEKVISKINPSFRENLKSIVDPIKKPSPKKKTTKKQKTSLSKQKRNDRKKK
ncbi:endopeptidase La [Leptospira kirschneri]|uniref:Lon protease n=1 Tax=Leptospira kirschneri str. 200802841 TaxID=1193047 RepID=A0A828XTC5_9LEPT|nr:endopeptidase La [Leptospira kirschneri]EKO50488.1 endopeptidase La [Leptospira kirschneri str. 200802841]EKQ84752.1 endopeptidase La [Leptospira kirschneri serovar Grippotyphosa str. Moskva]EKR08062.1 endopeptidase La [Leptospira kirschneri serovar Valbuzzi str. 200702274]EMK17645.1 endopeptidase La [Leptospira kirschneri serovar Bim str. PUO 1247]EMN03719.1 endopeptidase La [Leptospira kirschneri serovar Bim str. 1051]